MSARAACRVSWVGVCGLALLGAILAVEEGAQDPTWAAATADAAFDNDAFEIRPCSAQVETPPRPNFSYGDIEVSWTQDGLNGYVMANRPVTEEEWRRTIVDCLQSLGRR
jgi:hypothetical protein